MQKKIRMTNITEIASIPSQKSFIAESTCLFL